MRFDRWCIGILLLVIALLVATRSAPAQSQQPMRVFGTSSTGAAVPIGVDGDSLKAACQ